MILAIEPGDPRLPPHIHGSIQRPRRWLRINIIAGTSAVEFNDFLIEILDDLDNNPLPGVPPEGKVFLWDNLRSHLTPMIYNTVAVRAAGHTINPRPPYRPWVGPIEFIFCQLADRLRQRCHLIHSIPDLVHQIQIVVPELTGFDNTFAHCGYPP